MIFLYILFGVSLIGIFSILIFRGLRPNNNEDNFSNDDLKNHLENVKKLAVLRGKGLGKNLGKGLSFAYERGVSKVKNTSVSNLVQGRGVLKQKETSSTFLKDVKEHKDKVREELTNGNSLEKKKKDDNLDT